MRTFSDGRDFALAKDAADVLAPFSDRFYKLKDTIYMDGNSLGLLSKDAEASLLKALGDWKVQAIDVWGSGGYFTYQDKLAEKCAKLINADPEEVTIGMSTTLNVHQLVATLFDPATGRDKILVDDLNFPTDRYALVSQLKLRGLDPEKHLKTVASRDGQLIYEDDIIDAMTDDVGIVLLPSALYRSAQLVDMKKIASAAHERGICAGFDLCHSIGAVPHDFKDIDPDFAVWCNYKYLNAGPGAVAGMFIAKRHFSKEPGLAGWWGNDRETMFDLRPEFEHARGAAGLHTGTHSVLAMAPLEGSLDMILEAGIENIREKSLDLTAYLMYLIDTRLAKYGFSVGNPREDERRTGHVALVHDDAIRINAAMKARGVLPDFRFPNVIRLAPVALYTSYAEIYDMVGTIEDIMVTKQYELFENKRGTVA